MSIRTIAIYTEPDAASTHVSEADVAVLLPGSPAKAYIDGYEILRSCFIISFLRENLPIVHLVILESFSNAPLLTSRKVLFLSRYGLPFLFLLFFEPLWNVKYQYIDSDDIYALPETKLLR